jgi:hypothetical protein
LKAVRNLLLGIALAAAATAVHADADVQLTSAGLMSIRAANVPLREILDRVEDKTGMKTIYDGAPPAQLVTVTLADLTPAAAIVQLLEGRGVRFAMATDRVGARVVTLLLTTVTVEIKALPPPSPLNDIPFMSNGEPALNGEPTDELPPWLPERPAWWPKPGEAAKPGDHPESPDAAAPREVSTPAPSNLMPTPPPYSVSPFTPQGPGPIILAPPGSSAPVTKERSEIPYVPALPHPNPKSYVN